MQPSPATHFEDDVFISDEQAEDAFVGEVVERRVEDVGRERRQHTAEEDHPA